MRRCCAHPNDYAISGQDCHADLGAACILSSRKSMEWAAFLLTPQFRSVRGTRGTCPLTCAGADEVAFDVLSRLFRRLFSENAVRGS